LLVNILMVLKRNCIEIDIKNIQKLNLTGSIVIWLLFLDTKRAILNHLRKSPSSLLFSISSTIFKSQTYCNVPSQTNTSPPCRTILPSLISDVAAWTRRELVIEIIQIYAMLTIPWNIPMKYLHEISPTYPFLLLQSPFCFTIHYLLRFCHKQQLRQVSKVPMIFFMKSHEITIKSPWNHH
jgi:hypothetical protein